MGTVGTRLPVPTVEDDESEALVWSLFSLRVALVETSAGPRRDALVREERALVDALGAEIDPHLHGDLARPAKTFEHDACF